MTCQNAFRLLTANADSSKEIFDMYILKNRGKGFVNPIKARLRIVPFTYGLGNIAETELHNNIEFTQEKNRHNMAIDED
jgi:hypothetical protein